MQTIMVGYAIFSFLEDDQYENKRTPVYGARPGAKKGRAKKGEQLNAIPEVESNYETSNRNTFIHSEPGIKSQGGRHSYRYGFFITFIALELHLIIKKEAKIVFQQSRVKVDGLSLIFRYEFN